MRHPIQRSNRFIRISSRSSLIGLCLSSLLLANFARAQIDYWDPQGTTGANPYAGDMSGTWENNDWSTSSAGAASPTGWVEGDTAGFGVNTGYGTPAFTVTMNANHSIAGVFDGNPLLPGPNAAQVTINGTGQWLLAGAQPFSSRYGYDDSVGSVTIDVPIVDGQTPGQVDVEGESTIRVNGANTYSGGTLLGTASASWTGVLHFNNNQSFGTGNIALINGGGILMAENAGINIHNNLDFSQAISSTAGLSIDGLVSGSTTTFSGNVTLGNKAVSLDTGSTPGTLVKLTGVISGSGSLTKFDGSTLEVTGANTYTGTTTVSLGKLLLGAANTIASSRRVILSGSSNLGGCILDLGGFSHAMGNTTLQVTGNSSINFSGSANSISFANSSSLSWSGVLNLADWTGNGYTGTQLQFGNSSGGLTSAQLADIEFDGNAATLGEAGIDANGFITEAPEPSSIVVGLLGGLGMMWTIRRRKA